MPKTKRWREIAGEAAETSLLAARARLEALADVPEVQRAWTFLIALPIASRAPTPTDALRKTFGIRLKGEPVVDTLTRALEAWTTDESGARTAAARTLAQFLHEQPATDSLFEPDPWQLWRDLDGSPFCELGRLFFGYMLERVLLDTLQLPQDPNTQRSEAPQYLPEQIALHAMETSKIVQPFVARWYNAQVKDKVPDAGNIRWFLDHSFGKLDLEIERELGGHPVVRSRSAHRQEAIEGL